MMQISELSCPELQQECQGGVHADVCLTASVVPGGRQLGHFRKNGDGFSRDRYLSPAGTSFTAQPPGHPLIARL